MSVPDKPLTHLLQQVALPKIRLATKVSRKTLQIYLDCKAASPSCEFSLGTPRVMSYSKLLQMQTPESFRQQRSKRGCRPALKPPIPRKSSFSGVQGVKSVLSGRHTSEFRQRVSELRRANLDFVPKQVDKGLDCPFEAENSEERLRETPIQMKRKERVKRWKSGDLLKKEEMIAPWSEETDELFLPPHPRPHFKPDPNAPKRPPPASAPPGDLSDIITTPPCKASPKSAQQGKPTRKSPPKRGAKSPQSAKDTADDPDPPEDEATYDPGQAESTAMDEDPPPKPKKGKKWYPIPKDLKDAPVRGLITKVRGGAKVVGMRPEKKQAPAATGPLAGKTFVITGLMEGVDRGELESILKSYGAKITGSVSKRTSYLVHGEKLEDGRAYTEGKKYQKAKELGVKIITQRELDELIMKVRCGEADPPAQPAQPSRKTPSSTPPAPPQKRAKTAPQHSQPILWTEKYSPQSLKDLIGNAPAVEKLVSWVRDWPTVVLKGQKKDVKPMRGGRFDAQLNVNAKAALLSGPPGIGKTTTARLVAKELGYRAIEMNASDVRSKAAILEPLKACSGSTALTNVGELTKTLLIMDEVDGMSAGDRGGVSALAEVVKTTRVPIICICNERSSPKLKQLSNVSYDIRFSRPNKTQISKRLTQIAAKEGLHVEPNGLEHIVESSGNDIRQVFTMLEMWGRSRDSLSFCDAKSTERTYRKDASVMINNFDAASLLLRREELAKRTLREKLDLFFIDFDLIPLLIQENYITAMGVNTETKTLEKMAQASESIAFGDAINRLIRNQNEWGLLNAYGLASCVDPGVRSGFGVPFPKFPEWFGRNSAQKKNERLLHEVRATMAGFVCGPDEDLITDYVPLLYQLLMHPLREQGRDGVSETFELMETYNLTPDMLRDHFVQLQFGPGKFEEEYKVLPTHVKSALTKMHNAAMAITASGGKGRKKTTLQVGEKEGSEGEQEAPAEEVGKFDPDIEERAA